MKAGKISAEHHSMPAQEEDLPFNQFGRRNGRLRRRRLTPIWMTAPDVHHTLFCPNRLFRELADIAFFGQRQVRA
jgi:hypothetical protein